MRTPPRASASRPKGPVFVLGMPRSGTSLAEQILASHPAVFGAGEVSFWDGAFERIPDGRAEEQARADLGHRR